MMGLSDVTPANLEDGFAKEFFLGNFHNFFTEFNLQVRI